MQDELSVVEVDGYRRLDPLPSNEDLAALYHKEFAGKTLKSGFREKKKKDEDYWRMAVERRLMTYRELLGSLERPRILDVGCGTGNVLRFFRDHGWEIQGIEPSEHFAPDLQENDIPNVRNMVEELSDQDWLSMGEFDVVNLSMVLEHIRNPETIVTLLTERAVRKGGILTIESPNDFNPLQQAAVEAHGLMRWWIHPLHLYYFDFESLEHLVRRCGLTPVLRECQFPMEVFMLFGDVYVGDQTTGRRCHEKRVSFETHLHRTGRQELLQKIYRALAGCGLGRTAIVHARKS